MVRFVNFYQECRQTSDQTTCIINLFIVIICLIADMLLLLQAILILIENYKRKKKIKIRITIILLISMIFSGIDIFLNIIGVFFIEIKIFLSFLITSLILLYIINKFQKKNEKTASNFIQPRIMLAFYVLMGFNNFANLSFTIIQILNSFNIFSVYLEFVFLILNQLCQFLNIFFLLVAFLIIKNYRKNAIQNFKFNVNTIQNFTKNQLLIESFSLFFLTFLVATLLKMFINMYLILKNQESSLYFVPMNITRRSLLNNIILLLLRFIIFYLPLYTSQRLFRNFKFKKLYSKKEINQEEIAASNLTILMNEDSQSPYFAIN